MLAYRARQAERGDKDDAQMAAVGRFECDTLTRMRDELAWVLGESVEPFTCPRELERAIMKVQALHLGSPARRRLELPKALEALRKARIAWEEEVGTAHLDDLDLTS